MAFLSQVMSTLANIVEYAISILACLVAWFRANAQWLGPILSGFSLVAAAAAAWTTFIFYHRKTLDAAWIESYRLLYAEFWKDEDIAAVRNFITNDLAYAEIEPILDKRLSTDSNTLDHEDNKKIEQIDKFCALLIRVKLSERRLKKPQRDLWNETYRDPWIAPAKKRAALRNYMIRFWPGLRSLLGDDRHGSSANRL
jgi:hypothetical protein